MTEVLIVILYVASGLVAGYAARRKGFLDWAWVAFGLFFGPLALLFILILNPKALAVGEVVRPVAPVALDDGTRMPTSHRSVVRETKVIDGEIVCKISGPSGRHHWVAQEVLSRVGKRAEN